jgi:pentatricopeptide repeat protein
LVPDEITYNTIIHGYCQEGQVEKAFQFHNKMVEKNFKPDVVTCNTLLCGLCKEGMLEKALKLFNTWISKGKDVDAVSYNTIILSLCKEKRFGEAFDLLEEMEEKKLGPDCYTYNAILGGLTDAGRMKDAEEFISKIAEKGKSENQFLELGKRQDARTSEIPQEPHPNAIAYSNKINELCSQGRYKDAMKIFHESTQKNIILLKSTYIDLMDGLIKRRKSTSKGMLSS